MVHNAVAFSAPNTLVDAGGEVFMAVLKLLPLFFSLRDKEFHTVTLANADDDNWQESQTMLSNVHVYHSRYVKA